MQQEAFDEKFLALLRQKQIFLSDPRKFADNIYPQILGVEVEIALDEGAQLAVPEFSVDIVSKRGVTTQITDFRLEDGHLKFIVSQQVPESVNLDHLLSNPYDLATPFLDLCWFVGNEDVSAEYKPTCKTELRAGSVLCDLGYYLPSRFIDPLIRALGDFNAIFLNGLLEESIVYGILYKNRTKELEIEKTSS